MINWILVATIPFAVLLGLEIGRRKQKAKGEIYHLQPHWLYRTLNAILAASVALFVEAAIAALNHPSQYHTWLLILSATTAQIAQLIVTVNETRYAKKKLAPTSHKGNK